jgi:pyrimidine-nucleoside phosphorylase
MDVPLGNAVGNSLEVEESLEILRGKGPEDLRESCLELMDNLLRLAGFPDGSRRSLALEKLKDGSAYRKFIEMTEAQGGDPSVFEKGFHEAGACREIYSDRSGVLTRLDAEAVGRAAGKLGAGRQEKGDSIDLAAGILLYKKPGHTVSAGEPVCEMRASDDRLFPAAEELLRGALEIC